MAGRVLLVSVRPGEEAWGSALAEPGVEVAGAGGVKESGNWLTAPKEVVELSLLRELFDRKSRVGCGSPTMVNPALSCAEPVELDGEDDELEPAEYPE